MRVSKEPSVRKQEIIDTAIKLFAAKGYEATSMTDIAKEMHVVSGLCYRYFSSKEELYRTALTEYAKECAKPMIEQLQGSYETVEEVMRKVSSTFCERDGKERYHSFFHGKGNEMFYHELEVRIISELQPYLQELIEQLQTKGAVQVTDVRTTTDFLLYGQMPVINNDVMTPEEKVEAILPLIRKVLL